MSEAADWRSRAREWTSLLEQESSQHRPTIGISSSFTANALVPQLGVAFYRESGERPEIILGEYNQLHQACLDVDDQFGQNVDPLILLWRIEDILWPQVQGVLSGHSNAVNEIMSGVETLIGLARQASSERSIVFASPPAIDALGLDPLDQSLHRPLRSIHRRVCDLVEASFEHVPSVSVFDLDQLVAASGRNSTRDTRRYLLYRQPYSDQFFSLLGTELARTWADKTRAFPKCIAIDCDNTLWGGIVGEDGIEGILLSDDFPGSAYQTLQRQLKRLKSMGVLLAIVSKNEAHAVDEVFDRHRGMILQRDDIAAWRVNWVPKSENISSLAVELNFGSESFVFIDDSKFEIDEVQTALPDVRTLLVPEEPAQIPELLPNSALFRGLKANDDDLQRTLRIQQESERRSATESMTREDFLASLGLKVTLRTLQPDQLERTVQLINKTNQFNLTTIRRDANEVSRLANAADSTVLTCDVSDRFGDYGLVGVVILTGLGEPEWTVDTLLLSCRVLGREVEFAVLAAVERLAERQAAKGLIGVYTPTAKNGQVADLYERAGFEKTSDREFLWNTGYETKVPKHINLCMDSVASNPVSSG